MKRPNNLVQGASVYFHWPSDDKKIYEKKQSANRKQEERLGTLSLVSRQIPGILPPMPRSAALLLS
jgi:hypothetical protein